MWLKFPSSLPRVCHMWTWFDAPNACIIRDPMTLSNLPWYYCKCTGTNDIDTREETASNSVPVHTHFYAWQTYDSTSNFHPSITSLGCYGDQTSAVKECRWGNGQETIHLLTCQHIVPTVASILGVVWWRSVLFSIMRVLWWKLAEVKTYKQFYTCVITLVLPFNLIHLLKSSI